MCVYKQPLNVSIFWISASLVRFFRRASVLLVF